MHIDVSGVRSSAELHELLARAFQFPDFYGCNWDAFWDAITGLVEMPRNLRVSGIATLGSVLPRDCGHLVNCLQALNAESPAVFDSLLLED